jgi:hypothetical protein
VRGLSYKLGRINHRGDYHTMNMVDSERRATHNVSQLRVRDALAVAHDQRLELRQYTVGRSAIARVGSATWNASGFMSDAATAATAAVF